VFNDRCVQLMALVFFGVFFLSALFARQKDSWPLYAQHILTDQFVEQIEKMYEEPLRGRSSQIDTYMAAFYIQHNTGIGLQCFVGGLFVIPGLYITISNAAQLGATFGYMDRPDVEGQYFFEFVTAHGPFELTAIALSAGAGLRLGLSWIRTGGLSRLASLHKTAKEAMPLMGSAMVLFFLAALVEGFLSPSELPFWFKRLVAILSSGMLMFYFLLLGYPRR
jgi:uncharacterized membrane protein SpoIIM required for sporulation